MVTYASSPSHYYRLAAWLACLVMVMNTIAPLLTQAMALTRGEQVLLMTVCTADGTQQRRIDVSAQADESPANENPAGRHYGRVPLLHPLDRLGRPAPGTALIESLRRRPSAMAPRLRFYAAHDALFAWTAASPRGPPQDLLIVPDRATRTSGAGLVRIQCRIMEADNAHFDISSASRRSRTEPRCSATAQVDT
jgi:hypothetical protein